MSYAHYILVPGAPGHDDPEALRAVIEEYGDFDDIQRERALLEAILDHEGWPELVDIHRQLKALEKDLSNLSETLGALDGISEEHADRLSAAWDDTSRARFELQLALEGFSDAGVPGLEVK